MTQISYNFLIFQYIDLMFHDLFKNPHFCIFDLIDLFNIFDFQNLLSEKNQSIKSNIQK
jgi:hypothetical protein